MGLIQIDVIMLAQTMNNKMKMEEIREEALQKILQMHYKCSLNRKNKVINTQPYQRVNILIIHDPINREMICVSIYWILDTYSIFLNQLTSLQVVHLSTWAACLLSSDLVSLLKQFSSPYQFEGEDEGINVSTYIIFFIG